MNLNPIQRTPMYYQHVASQAKMNQLAGWDVAESYTVETEEREIITGGVSLSDLSFLGKLELRGEGAQELLQPALVQNVPEINSSMLTQQGWRLMCLAPDEFMLITQPGTSLDAERQLRQNIENLDKTISLINTTTGWAVIGLVGPRSEALLRRVCALDLRSQPFPNHSAVAAPVATIRSLVVRADCGQTRAFQVFVAWSYGSYLWELFIDVGQALGTKPVGYRMYQKLANQVLGT